MVSEDFDGKILNWQKDSAGRILSLLIEKNNTKVHFVNIYVPMVLTERKEFYVHLHEFFLPADCIILGGDFNCYERESDKYGGNVSLAKYSTNFRSSFNLVDIWRKFHLQSRKSHG